MFKLSGDTEQRILGNAKGLQRQKGPHSVKCDKLSHSFELGHTQSAGTSKSLEEGTNCCRFSEESKKYFLKEHSYLSSVKMPLSYCN